MRFRCLAPHGFHRVQRCADATHRFGPCLRGSQPPRGRTPISQAGGLSRCTHDCGKPECPTRGPEQQRDDDCW